MILHHSYIKPKNLEATLLFVCVFSDVVHLQIQTSQMSTSALDIVLTWTHPRAVEVNAIVTVERLHQNVPLIVPQVKSVRGERVRVNIANYCGHYCKSEGAHLRFLKDTFRESPCANANPPSSVMSLDPRLHCSSNKTARRVDGNEKRV